MKDKLFQSKIWIFVSLFLIFGVFFTLFFVLNSKNKPLGTVNGVPFYAEELLMYAESSRAAVNALYSEKYNLSSTGSDFWDTPQEGSTPKQWLLDAAMKQLVYNKVIQQECVSRGVVAPLDFLQMKQAMEQENESRSHAISQGAAVFGTTAYTLSQYNDYVMSFAIDDLKAYLLKNELSPTQQQLQDAYDTLDESFKRRHYKCSGFRITLPDDSLSLPALEQQISSLLAQNQSMEQIAQSTQLPFSPFSFDSTEIHREDTFSASLNEALFFVEKNEISSVQYEPEPTVYYISEKEGGGYHSFEELPRLGENKYINDAFDAFIEKQVQAAAVSYSQDKALKELDKIL